MSRRGFFFDRDGVLNRDFNYVFRAENFEWMPGAKEAIRLLNDEKIFVFVITNQGGIAREFYSEADVKALHLWMRDELKKDSAHIDGFYYCPHHPTEGIGEYRLDCECRKPKPGMIFEAAKEWQIDLKNSYLIGDKPSDIEAGRAAGIPHLRLFTADEPLDRIVRKMIAS